MMYAKTHKIHIFSAFFSQVYAAEQLLIPGSVRAKIISQWIDLKWNAGLRSGQGCDIYFSKATWQMGLLPSIGRKDYANESEWRSIHVKSNPEWRRWQRLAKHKCIFYFKISRLSGSIQLQYFSIELLFCRGNTKTCRKIYNTRSEPLHLS